MKVDGDRLVQRDDDFSPHGGYMRQNKFHHPTRSRPHVEFLHPGRIEFRKKDSRKKKYYHSLIVMNFMLGYLHFKFADKFC